MYETPDGTVRASVAFINYKDFIPAGIGTSVERVLHFVLPAHEFGHNFGLAHANRAQIRQGTNDYESFEQEDLHDIMGVSINHLNAPHKEEAVWLNPENIVVIDADNKFGEYTLKPLETTQPLHSIQQIKLPLRVKPNVFECQILCTNPPQCTTTSKQCSTESHYSSADKVYYTLEFRQPFDYDDGSQVTGLYSGVTIHLSAEPKENLPFKTNILNYVIFNNPATNQVVALPPKLRIGQPFEDSANGYKVTLRSADANGAVVNIEKIS